VDQIYFFVVAKIHSCGQSSLSNLGCTSPATTGWQSCCSTRSPAPMGWTWVCRATTRWSSRRGGGGLLIIGKADVIADRSTYKSYPFW